VDVYRSEPRDPQFICVVCYRSLSVHAGECPHCGVERLPLADPEVRADVRGEAERRVQNRLYGEWFWSYLVAFIAAVPVRFFVGDILKAMALWVTAGVLLGAANVKLYERLNARSMLRLVAERRRRFALATAPGGAQKLLPARADDPEDADLPHVLELLGARSDDK
jgi:hypothetical protein